MFFQQDREVRWTIWKSIRIEVIFIKIVDFLKSKLIGKESYTLKTSELEAFLNNNKSQAAFKVAEIALFTTIDLIARTLSKCRFCTVENGKEVEKREYYSWNYAPNFHQTKVEFIIELVSKLILCNEVLVFETANGQRLIADSFSKEIDALKGDTFTDVTAFNHTFPRSYLSSEVIYLRYNNRSVRELLIELCNSYENLINKAEKKYSRAADKKVLVEFSMIAQNAPDFEKKQRDLLQNKFRAFFAEGDAAVPIFEGVKINDTSKISSGYSSENDVNDIVKLMDTATQIVANAFHINPAIIRGDASQLDDAFESSIANAVDPIAQMLEQEITAKNYGEVSVLKGSYLHIDTTYAKHLDPISSAVNVDKAIAARVLTPAQSQRYCGMVPDDSKSANMYYITRNYQTAELAVAEGGENNA